MTQIALHGCRSEPLASYLKSLAVLRLVSEQKDTNAKGWWWGGEFYLDSSLDEEGLIRFLADEYAPTPIVAPWNGGSGFSEGDPTVGLDFIVASTSPRFVPYKRTIKEIRSWPEMPATDLTLGQLLSKGEELARGASGEKARNLTELIETTRNSIEEARNGLTPNIPEELTIEGIEGSAKGPGTQFATLRMLLKSAKKLRTKVKGASRAAGKEAIVRACRERLDDGVVEWLDAAVAIGPDGELGLPPILGTGGNEGRLDYSSTFMSCISGMLLDASRASESQELLTGAILGGTASGLEESKTGQFDPGRAGGYNQGSGIEKKEFLANPWDIILALEGSVAWAGAVSRRKRADSASASVKRAARSIASSPFTVRVRAVGYSSSSSEDTDGAPAELWVPIWRRPTGYRELRAFLSEGRADIGRRPASHTIEFAEAVASLGTDRGVEEFMRFSLLKRRGKSYIALPTGRLQVKERTGSDLLRELDPLLARLDHFLRKYKAKGQEPPARLKSARRDIDEAIYDMLQRDGAVNVKSLVAALGRMETVLAQRDPGKEPRLDAPLQGLSPRWLVAFDDGSIEVRLAASLASIGATGDVGPIRANLAPVDPKKPWAWAMGGAQTAWSGTNLAAKIANVLARRMMDAGRLDCRTNPTYGLLPLRSEDISGLVEGGLDEQLIEDLLFGLSWVRWSDRTALGEAQKVLLERWSEPVTEREIPRSWTQLKLLYLPSKLAIRGKEPVEVRPEPSIIPLLRANRVRDACHVAQRRLFSAGLAPSRAKFPDTGDGTRIAAALLLPVRDVRSLSRLVIGSE